MENSAYKKSTICDIFINRGVDLSGILNFIVWTGRNSISTLVAMYAEGPRSFVHEFAFRHIGLEEYWEMTNVNSWLLRAIARSEPRFSSKLRAQEEALRFSRNHGRSKTRWLGLDLSIETQLIEMKQAKSSERQSYLLAMCAGGTAADLDALIAHPEDVPELVSTVFSGARLRRYLNVSAEYGNQETFCRLLDATVGYPTVEANPCKSLSGRHKIPSQFNDSPSSYEVRAKMMRRLLTKSGVSADIMARLMPTLIKPYGSRISKTRSSCHLSRINLNPEIPKRAPNNTQTEIAQNGWIVEAVTAQNEYDVLKLLVHHGFDLDWQNEDGFTPLMIAIAIGSKQATQILIKAGADLHQRKSCGFSVSELGRALRTEVETRGCLDSHRFLKLLGNIHRLPFSKYPPTGLKNWFDNTAREELLEILALVSHVDLELENDSGEVSLDLDTISTSGKSYSRAVYISRYLAYLIPFPGHLNKFTPITPYSTCIYRAAYKD
jgi:hypothetical protein